MKQGFLVRQESSEQGTKSRLFTLCGFICCAMELPWKDNQTNISCIPADSYILKPWQSRRFGNVYIFTDVMGRTYVLTHRGNFAGDVSLDWKTHSHGCVLLGKYFGQLNLADGRWQEAVMLSRPTVSAFRKHMGDEPFKLTVIDAYKLAA